MIAATSGGLGDIVYSIPVMHRLGVKTVYVKESYYYPPYGNLYTAIKRLLESQGFECLPTSGDYPPFEFDPAIKFDYNMDLARRQPKRGLNHIIISYLNQFNLPHTGWNTPFLKLGSKGFAHTYSLIHRTPRWRKHSRVKWKEIIPRLESPVFIGFRDEYKAFVEETGIFIPYMECTDILEMAYLIKDCKVLLCNQSVALTIAQGLGKEYYLERNPVKSNALFKTHNEHIL